MTAAEDAGATESLSTLARPAARVDITLARPPATAEPTGVPLREAPPASGPRRRDKRALDLVLGALVLVAAAPLLLLLALLVRCSGPGPILFTQERVGQGGRRIVVRKFRTMVADAEQRRAGPEKTDRPATGPVLKLRDDPRITRTGRWLRRTSLDELPQLLSVLTGTMSLVGPRPIVSEELAQYGPEVHRRLLVKPGMTGLWQVSGRSDLDWTQRVQLDLDYVERQSAWLDLRILLRTVPAVLLGRGAY